MSRTLTHRLQLLKESHRSTLTLIQELQSLPFAESETYRAELASEIHDTLKEHEDTLDLLRLEIEDSPPPPSSHRISNSQRESDRERNVDLVERLTEDLKSTRAKFRRAQLSAKRNADEAKRREREKLFRRSHEPDENGEVAPQSQRRHGGQQLTQEELARNASEDVTRALRRTHALLQSNLSQSQFAQQTLDQSQDALKGLAESYGGTTDLLKNSRGLVGQLVRSNKSDTWYLQTAFYMLAITIAWLFFRRLLYGPLWWLVWQPLKMLWWFTFMALGGMGFRGEKRVEAISSARAMSTSARPSMMSGIGVNSRGIPTNPPGEHRSVQLPAKGGGWAGGPPAQAPTMVEKVGRMVDGSAELQNTNVDDIPEEERRKQAEQPRNPKKRMMEVDLEKDRGKDEL